MMSPRLASNSPTWANASLRSHRWSAKVCRMRRLPSVSSCSLTQPERPSAAYWPNSRSGTGSTSPFSGIRPTCQTAEQHRMRSRSLVDGRRLHPAVFFCVSMHILAIEVRHLVHQGHIELEALRLVEVFGRICVIAFVGRLLTQSPHAFLVFLVELLAVSHRIL